MKILSGLLVFWFLVLLAIPLFGQAQISRDSSNKNVLIFFDASFSMIEEQEGEKPVMPEMLLLLKEVMKREEFIRDGDFVAVRKFADRSEPFDEVCEDFKANQHKRLLINNTIDSLRDNYESVKKSLKAKGHNDFITLIDHIAGEITSTKRIGKSLNLVILFSDFWYDPRATKSQLQQHKKQLADKLPLYENIFETYQYRLIIIYKPNPKKFKKGFQGGIDVYSSYRNIKYIDSISSFKSMEEVAKNLWKKSFWPIRVNEANGGFQFNEIEKKFYLELELENPNYIPIYLNTIQTEEIINTRNRDRFAYASRKNINKTIDPGEKLSVLIPLESTITDYRKLEDKGIIGDNYEFHYTLESDIRDFIGDSKVRFHEAKLNTEINEVIITKDLIFKNLNKLSYKISFTGRTWESSQVKVETYLGDKILKPISSKQTDTLFMFDKKVDVQKVLVYEIESEDVLSIESNALQLAVNFERIEDGISSDASPLGLKPYYQEIDKDSIHIQRSRNLAIAFSLSLLLVFYISFKYQNEIRSIRILTGTTVNNLAWSLWQLFSYGFTYMYWPIDGGSFWSVDLYSAIASSILGVGFAFAVCQPVLLRYLWNHSKADIEEDQFLYKTTWIFWISMILICFLLTAISYYVLGLILAIY